jgi:hypothetical protein
MGNLGFTRLTTVQTWEKPPPPFYNIFCASSQGPDPNGILSWDSQMGVSKFPKLGLLQLEGPIILCANLWLGCGSKQSFSLHQELSNGMLHATYTQRNQVESGLLVVGSQIANLTPDLSFSYNLCFRCPNGSCEPILDIYVSISFQWYKELSNPMVFYPYNHILKIWESIGTPTPQMGVHLGVWRFIPRSMRCNYHASLLAYNLKSPLTLT